MNKIGSISDIALAGIQGGLRQLDAASREIAKPLDRTEPAELVGPILDALEAQRTVEASAKVLQRTDEVLSALLDTAPNRANQSR